MLHLPVIKSLANRCCGFAVSSKLSDMLTACMVLAVQAKTGTSICKSTCRLVLLDVQVVRTGRQLTASNGKPYDIILVDEAQVRSYRLLLQTQADAADAMCHSPHS